jgi:hypothetical protein
MTINYETKQVGPDEFRQVMAPTVTAIRDLTDAIKATVARHGDIPADGSRAMREVAAEAAYIARCPDWTGPMRDAHTLGGVTLGAATDFARGFAELFDASVTPMYAHLVTARSVLESSVVSHWLSDPDLSYDARVKRALSELLYSAKELSRMGVEDQAASVGRLQKWLDAATAFDWEVLWPFRRPTVDGEGRPSVPEGINKLLLRDGDWKLGRVQWSYLSSVSHATWYGLAQAVQEPPKDSLIALAKAAFGTNSGSAQAQAVCVLGAARKAAMARFTLMGWIDDEFRAAARASIEHEAALVRAFPIDDKPAEVDGSDE